jgi:hypothetical protein
MALLCDAARAVDVVLESHPSHTTTSSDATIRITLLEGERVGALALSCIVRHAVDDMAGKRRAKEELLDVGARLLVHGVSSMPPLLPGYECEVLYGRCGYLHAISCVRSGTDDIGYGGGMVARIVEAVLEEGVRTSIEKRGSAIGNGDMPLLWTWHGKMYLGAIHGVVGILFTLLCFRNEISCMEGAMDTIRTTILRLDGHCHASGNLMPALGGESRDDRLVHLCHGAPGHVLLLAKAYEVYDDVTLLERAEEIARGVICRRGLLRKGIVPSFIISREYNRTEIKI